jgi:hypothetical protein
MTPGFCRQLMTAFALGAMVYDLGLRTPGLEADLTWWLGLT